uniref:Variant surface glycoprotein n=1 Tax=Trypanosoma brucei TaxID=5691 RepID=A0A1V0FYD8_9TRYP|nr:variant surface glycoprotein [Trypanosoma brucei]
MILRIELTIIFSAVTGRSADKNANELRAMCRLYKLLTTTPPEQLLESCTNGAIKLTLQDKINSIQRDILMPNIKLADDGVLATLKDTTKYTNQASTKESGKKVAYFTGITEEKFAVMRQAHAKLFEKGQEGDNRRKTYNLPVDAKLKHKLTPVFYQLERKASKIAEELAFASSHLATERTAAAQAMVKASFGANYQPKMVAKTQLADGISKIAQANSPWSGINRHNVCKAAAKEKGKAGGALATDMLCLCLPMNSGDSNNYCKTSPATPASASAINSATAASAQFEKNATNLCMRNTRSCNEPNGSEPESSSSQNFGDARQKPQRAHRGNKHRRARR